MTQTIQNKPAFFHQFAQIFTFGFLCFFTVPATAQPNLDSLFGIWQDPSKSDSVRVAAYYDFLWDGYLYSKPDTAFLLAENLKTFAKKQKYRKALARAYSIQGVANDIQGNYPGALENYKKSLSIFEELGDKRGIAASQNNIGIIYKNQGNYPRALEYYQKSLKIQEELGNKKGIAPGLNNIGNLYRRQENYPRALEYYKKSLKIQQELGDNMEIATVLTNIGLVESEVGNYARALAYFNESLKIFEELNSKSEISNCLNNIGNIYKKEGKYPLALVYLKRSLTIFEELGDKYGIAGTHNYIGLLYQQEKNYSNAINFCLQGFTLAQKLGVLPEQRDACQCLYDSYKAMGNGSSALVYLEKLNVINDSLRLEETGQKLQQMEFAKKIQQDSIASIVKAKDIQEAHEEEVRQKNRNRNLALATGGLVLIFATGLYSRLRYVRKSNAALQVEKNRSDDLLLNILPEEIARELKEKGRAEPRDFDLVSIIFTDFKGFTEQSAKLTAKELVGEINRCFEAFDNIIEKYNVEKIKTIGDAYMAAGGLPVPTKGSVKNTVLAALEMQQFIAKEKSKNESEGKPVFEMRAGIHTGPVVAGIVGVKKFQYDIWGDTVNTANRMESSGEVGKINISQATYELLKNDPDFVFEPRGKIEAKGKGEMEMWFVELSERKESSI